MIPTRARAIYRALIGLFAIPVAIAAQEVTNNGDVVQIESASASTVTVTVADAITAEEVSDDGDAVEVEVSDDGEVVEEALRGGRREDRARGEEGD